MIARWMCTALAAVFGALMAVDPALAEPGVALVIGNGDYDDDALDLPNPQNDATIISSKLAGRGFEVVTLVDGDGDEMVAAIERFIARAAQRGPDASHFVYFSGHAIQIGGTNYLFPADVRLDDSDRLKASTITLQSILQSVSGLPSVLNFVVLDACRDNAFAQGEASSGLASVGSVDNAFIAFSTAPGMVAFDGDGRNSRFTAALALALGDEFASAQQVFNRARAATIRSTDGGQVPEFVDSLALSAGDPWKIQPIGRTRVGFTRGRPTGGGMAEQSGRHLRTAGTLAQERIAGMSGAQVMRFARALRIALDSGDAELAIKPDYTHEAYPDMIRAISRLPETADWSHYDLALFLAHAAHETYQFQALSEYGSSRFFERYDGDSRLGNVEAGDGERFRGRGLLQLRGRAIYAQLSDEMGVDLVADPDLLRRDEALSLRASALAFNRLRGAITHVPEADLRATTLAHMGSGDDIGFRAYYFMRLLGALASP